MLACYILLSGGVRAYQLMIKGSTHKEAPIAGVTAADPLPFYNVHNCRIATVGAHRANCLDTTSDSASQQDWEDLFGAMPAAQSAESPRFFGTAVSTRKSCNLMSWMHLTKGARLDFETK